MSFIVLDLEWNQAMSSKSSVFNRLPIHLRGEIIQIGAVKLNEDFTPGEEFQVDIKPIYFRRMHYKVKKLTGFDKERLSHGTDFKAAFSHFQDWCGPSPTFITWGFDDQGILEQNIIIHDLEWDWIEGWINLQLIYNQHIGGDRNQKSLKAAMEYFEIPQTRVAHDALGDAYNTALVGSHLNLQDGIMNYNEIVRIQSTHLPKDIAPAPDGPQPLEHTAFHGYDTRSAAVEDEKVSQVHCPHCATAMSGQRWIDQGDRRYMSIFSCPEHGKFLVRLKFRKSDDNSWNVNRIIYEADPGMEEFYRAKANSGNKRSRNRRRRKRISDTSPR